MFQWLRRWRQERDLAVLRAELGPKMLQLAALPLKRDVGSDERFWLWSQPLLTYVAKHHPRLFARQEVPGLLGAVAIIAEERGLMTRSEAVRGARYTLDRMVDSALRDGG